MTAPLVYWQSGGSIETRGRGLTDADATALINLYRDEAKAAWKAGDYPAHEIAADLHGQLYTARLKAREWVKASGPASFQNMRRAA